MLWKIHALICFIIFKQFTDQSSTATDDLENIGQCFLLYNEGIIHYQVSASKICWIFFNSQFQLYFWIKRTVHLISLNALL